MPSASSSLTTCEWEEALDNKIAEGVIPVALPFIKQQALEVVNAEYTSREEAKAEIADRLSNWYAKNYPQLPDREQLVVKAIAGVQTAYTENVFPEMNIGWGTYVNHVGHGPDFEVGCFRCHDDMHVSSDGQTISADCNTCHTLLALEEESPEILQTLRDE